VANWDLDAETPELGDFFKIFFKTISKTNKEFKQNNKKNGILSAWNYIF